MNLNYLTRYTGAQKTVEISGVRKNSFFLKKIDKYLKKNYVAIASINQAQRALGHPSAISTSFPCQIIDLIFVLDFFPEKKHFFSFLTPRGAPTVLILA